MKADSIYQNIGKRIKELRNRNGLTQQELADRTELTKGYISQLERGQVAPSVVTLFDLIECLGTTAADFFREFHSLAAVGLLNEVFPSPAVFVGAEEQVYHGTEGQNIV